VRNFSAKNYKTISMGYYILSAVILMGFIANFLMNGVYSSILYSFPVIIITFVIGVFYNKKAKKVENTY